MNSVKPIQTAKALTAILEKQTTKIKKKPSKPTPEMIVGNIMKK